MEWGRGEFLQFHERKCGTLSAWLDGTAPKNERKGRGVRSISFWGGEYKSFPHARKREN